QRVGARPRPGGGRRRAAAGHPAGRDRLPLLHQLALAVGRPRDLAVALARGRAGDPPLRAPPRAPPEEPGGRDPPPGQRAPRPGLGEGGRRRRPRGPPPLPAGRRRGAAAGARRARGPHVEPAPPAAAAMTGQEAPVELARQRLQRLTATLVVAVLPWLVAPGTLQPDTKTALVLAPARYLQRALWAWNDHTGIGELQNQAYGYLWPMGPFFLAGDVAGLPGWVVQRGWWTLLLVLAFLGAERLARRLAGLAPVPALLTGAVFALSPRVLTVLAEISVEVWPYALAPWLVLAADRAVRPGARAADRRRAAVATGLLTACLGGVNATVSLVALVPAALWVLTAPRGRARFRALAWWLLGALLGGLWWLGPLVVLGGYAYPFLDHIELASTTTAVASVTNVLRGADPWIAYILADGEHPTWQSGWVLAQSVTAILATCALAGLGLAGLLRRRAAEREVGEPEGLESVEVADAGPGRLTRWALVLVLLGVVTMSVGRSGAASGPFAETVQGWLDGPLAPLRNVHKADLLVRLPIALGAGLLAHWATRTTRGPGPVVRQVVV